jgi:hypothetical protein
MGDYIVSIQTDFPKRVVEYCVTEVPSLESDLRSELARVLRSTSAASASFLKRHSSAELSEPAPNGMRAEADEFAKSMLEGAKAYDPQAYCPWLLGSLRKTTAQSFEASLESAYAHYVNLSKQSARPKEK